MPDYSFLAKKYSSKMLARPISNGLGAENLLEEIVLNDKDKVFK